MGNIWVKIKTWFGKGDEDGGNSPVRRSYSSSVRPRGSLIYMQKQDPTVRGIGSRPVWCPVTIYSGPRSSDIKVKSGSTVRSTDLDDNFLYSRDDHYHEYLAVSVFGIVNHILTMYQRALKRMGAPVMARWFWGDAPIQVHTRAGEMLNAEYARTERSLFFYYYNDSKGRKVYTSESFDIVAHEVGHAILDGLKPRYLESREEPQTGALHESFGDITVILGLLEQLDMCEAVIAHSKCDLHASTFFDKLGEKMGSDLGQPMGLRNADNNLRIDQVTEEIHDLSRVFTGAFFDILVELFEQQLELESHDPAETLYRVGKYMSAIVIMGFLNGPEKNAKFADIAKSMMAAESKASLKVMFKKHFDKRRIFDKYAKPKAHVSAGPSGRCCPGLCGTYDYVHDPDFRHEVQETFRFIDFNNDDEDDDHHYTAAQPTENGSPEPEVTNINTADLDEMAHDLEETPLLDKKDM